MNTTVISKRHYTYMKRNFFYQSSDASKTKISAKEATEAAVVAETARPVRSTRTKTRAAKLAAEAEASANQDTGKNLHLIISQSHRYHVQN